MLIYSLKFIVTLFPLFLITGPFVPDLILCLSVLGFFFICIKHKSFGYFKIKAFYLFLLFCLLCIISSLFATDIFLSLESSLFYFRFGLFVFLVFYLIDRDNKLLKYFFIVY